MSPTHATLPTSTTGKYLKDDGTYETPTASVAITQTTIDAGTAPVIAFSAVVTDASVTSSSKIIVQQYDSGDTEENSGLWDPLTFSVRAGTGNFTIFAEARTPIRGVFRVQYTVA